MDAATDSHEKWLARARSIPPAKRAIVIEHMLRVFSGRYARAKGERPVTVCLNSPEKQIARNRLPALVIEKQREQESIVAPKSIRTTATVPPEALVNDYENDLHGRGLDEKHVNDTTTRWRRMFLGNGWRLISDVRPGAFVE